MAISNVLTYATIAAQVVAYVKTFIGGRYVYGATGPSAFDCSGLT